MDTIDLKRDGRRYEMLLSQVRPDNVALVFGVSAEWIAIAESYASPRYPGLGDLSP